MDYEQYKKSMKKKSLKYSNDEEEIVQHKFYIISQATLFERIVNKPDSKLKNEDTSCFYNLRKIHKASKYVDFSIDDLKQIAKFLNDASDQELERIDSSNIIDYLYKIAVPSLEKNKKIFQYNLAKANDESEYKDLDRPIEKPKWKKRDGIKAYPRDPKRIEECIRKSEHKCEYDTQHKFFTSKVNSKNYVEGHHFIPLQFQDDFDEYSLDVTANIVSLCVVCHAKLHHATFEEKKPILDKIYGERLERLKKCGLEISLETIYKYYKD